MEQLCSQGQPNERIYQKSLLRRKHALTLLGDGFHLVAQTKCSPGLSELQSLQPLQHQVEKSLLLQLFWGSWGKILEEMHHAWAVPLACE